MFVRGQRVPARVLMRLIALPLLGLGVVETLQRNNQLESVNETLQGLDCDASALS